jgi:hypothetical protein
MKTLWNIVSFLAVVHLLALVIFVGWLWQTKRLSAERMHQLKDVFAMTEPEAHAAAAKLASEAQAEVQKAADKEQQENPPLDTPTQIAYFSLIKQQEDQSLRRLESEKKALMEQLAASTVLVDSSKQELQQQRTEWDNAIKAERQRKVDEQFLQTVKQYEQLSPKQAKKMLMDLLTDNRSDQAVAYLDAMNPRATSKILKEFKTDSEITLATELLEKLRTFGMSTAPSPTAAPVQPGGPKTASATAPNVPAAPDTAHANDLASTRPN